MQVSLVLELKYSTNIFTKQNIADYNAILNFDVNAEKRIYIKLVGISEKELFMPHNCLNKICMIEKNKELQLIVLFTDSLTTNTKRGLNIQYFYKLNDVNCSKICTELL